MLVLVAETVIVLVTSVTAALIAMVLAGFVTWPRPARRRHTLLTRPPERTVFLFRDRDLVDASGAAQAILDASPATGPEWERLSAFLGARLPEYDARMTELEESGQPVVLSTSDGLKVEAEHLGSAIRIEVTDPTAEGQGVFVDGAARTATERELSDLREVVSIAPVLSWRLDGRGDVTWANRAYLKAVAQAQGESEDDLIWPLRNLFPDLPPSTGSRATRVRISDAAPEGGWFDHRVFESPTGAVHFATPADATVRAEKALRDFVQTLTKTFAHLPIGLAIFDRQRQLALFNPALIDLTALGPDFLSARPTLFAFLDRLREARMIPEPKDYPSWRARMNALEAAASSGHYEETWALSTGQTYRVIGRPHPDGAVAFLFEDITAEVSLTRRFRAELELGQNVIDGIEDALTVFSGAGTLVLSNAAYSSLWGFDPSRTFTVVSAEEAVAFWRKRSRPSALWDEAEEFLSLYGDRPDRTGECVLLDGRRVLARFRAMPGGASIVTFRVVGMDDMADPPVRRRTRRDVGPVRQAVTG
jgi:PAS domain-containing protein